MSTSNPLLRAALVPAVTAALLLGACSKPAQPIAAPKPVRVQAVALSAARPDDSYTGAVRARVESDLAFRVGGKVLRRLVDVGQPVRAGSIIAELDGADYELGADAAIHQQEAAAVDAEQAAADAARFARLLADGAMSQGDAERQRARADAARERLDQARRQVELAGNRAAYAVLRAPFDGVVTALHVEAGQVVGEAQPVVTLAKLGEREIVIDIPESRVLAARRATAATASLWAGDGARFKVALRELSPVASAATRTYRARYRIGSDAPPMELGMTATVWLEASVAGSAASADARVATLPASALHQHDGAAAVWTVATGAGTPTLVPVQVIRYGEEQVQLTGLSEGQLVVTAGVQKLFPGMSVVAVNADGRPIDGAVAALRGEAAPRTLAAAASSTPTR
jgi:RND family efflux transporter MFP subunit